MAETTDHPQVPPDAVMSEAALSTQGVTSSATYQPLSLLAMAGFGLSVIYVLVVLIGGAMSLLGHIPWLMPYWTFLIPIAALVVCWAARTRILNSEGTLSGLGFSTWGSRLAILFSITYAAYYFATFLAVRSPAIDCANDFFQKIKDGHLDQAFLMSQEMSIKGMSKEAMRDTIQSRFNQPMGGVAAASGTFTRFCQERFVRSLEMGGEQSSATPTGVSAWEYAKGGYRVTLTYHVVTSLVEFDMKVETFGRDPKPGEPKGRQWLVLFTRGETSLFPESIRETPRGQTFQQRTQKAMRFAREWTAKVSDVDSLQPAERESYSKLIRGYETFWAGREQRDDIIRRIRNSFQPSGGNRPPFNLSLQASGIPLLRENDARTTAWIDATIRYFDEGGMMPQYMVEGQLVVSADNSSAGDSAAAWRVDALEIQSGRTAPEMRRMQQRMGTPASDETGAGKGIKPPDKLPPPPLPGPPRQSQP